MHLSGPIEGLLVFSSELRKSNPTRKKTSGENKREQSICSASVKHSINCTSAKLKLFELFWDLSPFSEKKMMS